MGNENEIYVEGVFIIYASTKEVFFNRLSKLHDITGFSTGGFDSYEKDDDGNCWKVITTGYFEKFDDIQPVMNKMRQYSWFYDVDATLLIDGKEIYSAGKWIKQ